MRRFDNTIVFLKRHAEFISASRRRFRNRFGTARLFIVSMILFSSCSKGYDVRFANYYTEAMDSVVIGNNKIVFSPVAIEQTTDFKHLTKGNYTVKCIAKSKTVFNATISIPKSGSGKRTIQIDAIKNISVLEE